MLANPATDPRKLRQQRAPGPMMPPPPAPVANPAPPPGALTVQTAGGQQTSVPRPQPNPTTGQPMLQPPSSPVTPGFGPRPNAGGMVAAPPSSATPPTPNAQPTVLQGSGVRTTIPAAQYGSGPGKLGGNYDPDKPPPGYDPRAWRVTNEDIRSRGAHVYVTPDGQTHYGQSEGMGDAFGSADEFRQYLAGLPSDAARQYAKFANPNALRMLQGDGGATVVRPGAAGAVVPATQGNTGGGYQQLLGALTGAGGATGGPMLANAGGFAPDALPSLDGSGPRGAGNYQALISQLAAPNAPGYDSYGGAGYIASGARAGAPIGGGSGTQIAPITGDERPMAINPGGGPGALEGDLLAEARRQLAAPSVYDDALMQQGIEQARREAGRFFDEGDQALRAELASRGIEYGGIAQDRYRDLAADRQQRFQDMLLPLLRERATSIGGARTAAFNNALAAGEYGDARQRADRGELRGERAYRDSLRNEARDQALQEYLIGRDEGRYNDATYQQFLEYAMQLGQGGAGVGALGGAGGIYGQGAGAYGDEAAGYNDMLGQLLEYVLRARTGGGGGQTG